MRFEYDAIVVGGGPAGATAAILLARQGCRVAVVEKAAFPRPKVCGEFISATTWPLLRDLGVAQELARHAGPRVRRVAVFAGSSQVIAPMPGPGDMEGLGGCAVDRRILDSVLVDQARSMGATVWQPWAVGSFRTGATGHECTLQHRSDDRRPVLNAPLVVAAHGSWETGPLPTQQFREAARSADLLGFKAHFRGGELAEDLMPLITFPGGYGGMVNTSGGLVGLSCCIRRDALRQCRVRWPGRTAGEAVLAHIQQHCTGVAGLLSQATCEGAWLAAGPIRPGVRTFGSGGIFAVGNAAAEAHPVIAEGISIAIQSAALLCDALTPCLGDMPSPAATEKARHQYARAWRLNFLPRMRASALYAQIFMRPLSARIAVAAMQRLPSVLQVGAGWSGKARSMRPARSGVHPSPITSDPSPS